MKISTIFRGMLVPVLLLATASVAIAGDLNGIWRGEAEAIYPNGDSLAGLQFDGTIYQQEESGLFYGSFTYTLPGLGQISGAITGYIARGGEFSGLLSAFLSEGDPPTAVALVDGKLTGNKITATTRDFSDGTTSLLKASRVR